MRRVVFVSCVVALTSVTLSCREEQPVDDVVIIESSGDPGIYPTSDRPVASTCVAPVRQPPSGPIRLEAAFVSQLEGEVRDGLIEVVEDPHAPGSWLALQQGGLIHVFTASEQGRTLALDMSEELFIEQETGLIALEFDPSNPAFVYMIYMKPPEGSGKFRNIVARFAYDRQTRRIDPTSETILIDLPDPNGSHNVNDLVFGADSMLYIAIGDGGNPYDYLKNGQRPDTFFGTILRIDPRTPQGDRPYGIPQDNPFVDAQGAPTEVWAYGLRNPWRLSVDPQTGELWAGDVGQDTWEEVNVIRRGGNYGWPDMEGPVCYQKSDCDPADYILPYWSYTHAEGASITMGPVARDPALPDELQGRPLVGDFVNGNIWSIYPDEGDDILSTLLLESTHNISSWATAHDGSIFVVKYGARADGEVFRVVTRPDMATTGEDFPQTLSQTGCFDPVDPRQPLDGVLPYATRATLWSDGAQKKRYLFVPPDRRVQVDEDGDMVFPVGSMLFKEFAFEDQPHETRMMVHHADGWAGYTYRWREDGRDADLLPSQEIVTLGNGVRWVYPSRAQCMECHTAAAQRVLGPEYIQLDHVYDELDRTQVQWAALLGLELFNEEGEARLNAFSGKVDAMPDPFDERAPVAARARAYLHANCANCHRPGATSTQANIDLRYDTPFAQMGLCDQKSEHGNLYREGGSEFRLIKPGRSDQSIVYLRMETLDIFRMPPLASSVVDESGLALIDAWIDSMQDCP